MEKIEYSHIFKSNFNKNKLINFMGPNISCESQMFQLKFWEVSPTIHCHNPLKGQQLVL